jgi:predicted thioesterase
VFTLPVVGDTAETVHIVTDEDVAEVFGNTGVHVLGSPRLLHWIEQTALSFWSSRKDDTEAVLGIGFDFRHLAPTLPGSQVITRITVTEVQGSRVTYSVDGWDEAGQICDGIYRVFIMPLATFLARAAQRAGKA